jgi:hypothetical protein
MTASRLQSGEAQGLMLSITNVCSAPISGMRCFRLGHRDDSVRTTIAVFLLPSSEAVDEEETAECSTQVRCTVACSQKSAHLLVESYTLLEQSWQVVTLRCQWV